MTAAPHKTCTCGRAYSFAEWQALPFVGVAHYEFDGGDDGAELYEQRNCSECKNTMGVLVGTEDRILGLVSKALLEHRLMQATLVLAQGRCTELAEKCRRLEAARLTPKEIGHSIFALEMARLAVTPRAPKSALDLADIIRVLQKLPNDAARVEAVNAISDAFCIHCGGPHQQIGKHCCCANDE